MSHDNVKITYNCNLQALEELLSDVCRPGSFFAYGSKELPLPKMEIEGVGPLSFPIPKEQVKSVIQQATRAPYGRGDNTMLDMSVRKTWQLPPSQVRITGKSWETHFADILSTVKAGLGCQELNVRAELYKFLVYDEGGFFLPHRDTEKAPGMFGTLVVSLPSAHRGGELVVRHAGHEKVLDLSLCENSELYFAAFYADCEHEVKPVTEGYRVCLVYNLIQEKKDKKDKITQTLSAPLYDDKIAKATEILTQAFAAENPPAKIAWLLEHQYTQAELSFATLKNADAAIAGVLAKAASQADCAIHLGIVHIEESGSAEPHYDSYSRRSRRRWGEYDDDEEVESDDFDIVDVDDIEQYVDSWVNLHNQPADFGKLPIRDGELLPAGSLDDEEPDEQRLLEATGNEGVSYERSYHRAALIIWNREKYANVLLQSGLAAGMVYFKKRIQEGPLQASFDTWLTEMRRLANIILDEWISHISTSPNFWQITRMNNNANRAEMLGLLIQLKDLELIARFISSILMHAYDGTENDALIAATDLLGTHQVDTLFSDLISKKMCTRPIGCIHLFALLVALLAREKAHRKVQHNAPLRKTLETLAHTLIEKLKELKPNPLVPNRNEYHSDREEKITSQALVELWEALEILDVPLLREKMVAECMAHPHIFQPRTILTPALAERFKKHPEFHTNMEFLRLWQHAAAFLLAQSEHPPKAPSDWSQNVTLSCTCEECKDLGTFARNPTAQVHRFRIREERRKHIEQAINQHHLDMACITEETGSPKTLVTTKKRSKYEQACKEYQHDVKAMKVLASLIPDTPNTPSMPIDSIAPLHLRLMQIKNKRT